MARMARTADCSDGRTVDARRVRRRSRPSLDATRTTSQRVDELVVLRWKAWRQKPSDGGARRLLGGVVRLRRQVSKGEKGVVLLIAPDKKQAKVLLDYAEGTLQSTPLFSQLLEARTAETLTLTTGIVLEVRSASFRRIRGLTCVAVLGDEVAFWMSDDSVNPDIEILNAARPALATTQRPADLHLITLRKTRSIVGGS